MVNISLAAEKVLEIGHFPVTNSLLTTWIVMAVLFFIALSVRINLKKVPGYGQSIMEMTIGTLYDFFHGILGHQTKMVFPLVGSLFLFILLANWIGLLPGVGTIGIWEKEEGEKAEIVAEVQQKIIGEESAEGIIAETVTLSLIHI